MVLLLQDPPHTTKVLSGTSLLARSSFLLTPQGESTPVQSRLGIRIAYSIPRDEFDDDPDSMSTLDLNLMPLTLSVTEKLPWIKYHDVWHFIGPSLESHGWAHIPIDRGIPDTALVYDEVGHEDDRKIDIYGKLISRAIRHSEAKGMLMSHPLIKNHPVYKGLRNNTHYQTRREVQIPDDDFRLFEHEEINLYGDLVLRVYRNFTFPPESENPEISDLELRIAQTSMDDDFDPLLPGLLPLRIVLTQFFKGDLVGKICRDSYLITPSRLRLSHNYHVREKDGTEYQGRDRTFSKLGDYSDPISEMLSSRGVLPYELESNPDIQDLKHGTFFGGTPPSYPVCAA